MIPAALLTHRVVLDLPDVTGPLADVLPLEMWLDDCTEGPCAAEMDVIRFHRDGMCVICHADDRSKPAKWEFPAHETPQESP